MRWLAFMVTMAWVGLAAESAQACGGCFHEPIATESTVVTGHRMAMSISPTKFVLWDQIQYTGDPRDFSWVLPVKPGATIDVASPAFFEVLEAASTVSVQQPPEGCAPPARSSSGGSGCSVETSADDDDGAANTAAPRDGGVQVISEATVGPYETVTLSATESDALRGWLDDNGYALPADIAPIVDAYVAEGFDFIALKLAPSQGTNQMTPVRVESPGGGVTLPLRMVAAGSGARVDLVLYVIGEGRYQPRDFETAAIVPSLVTWDFREDRTDVGRLRQVAFERGDTWLTSFARRRALLEPLTDQLGPMSLDVGSPTGPASSLAEAYFRLGETGAPVDPVGCAARTRELANSMRRVVDNCDDAMNCAPIDTASEIGASDLACGQLDDIAVALVGLHPADTWVTRLETQLPRERLDADLVMEASDAQNEISNRFVAGLSINNCWDSERASSVPQLLPLDGDAPRLPPGGLGWTMVAGAALAFAMRRPRAATALH